MIQIKIEKYDDPDEVNKHKDDILHKTIHKTNKSKMMKMIA